MRAIPLTPLKLLKGRRKTNDRIICMPEGGRAVGWFRVKNLGFCCVLEASGGSLSGGKKKDDPAVNC